MMSLIGLVQGLAAWSPASQTSAPRRTRLAVTPELRERYAHLYEAQVEAQPDGSVTFAGGRRWVRSGVKVLHLKGDRFTMAFQHGKLLADAIADGALEQASRIAPNAIRNAVGAGVVGKLLTAFADRAITRTMLESALRQVDGPPQEFLGDAFGLSESTGVPVETIIAAGFGPETAQVLLGLTAPDDRGVTVGWGGGHCTSFAAWGEATVGGSLVIGRNTDYPLTGYYDRHPTLIQFEPTDGSHRFTSVTSAGLHNGGVCGINERGIYVDCHTVPTRHVSRSGTPVFMIAQEVLRRASSFEAALDLFRQKQPAAGWSYHVVSTQERRAATIEMAADRSEVRHSLGSIHVTTNHWLHPEMAPRYLHINAAADEDTLARSGRVRSLAEAANGQLDAAVAMRILGDKVDPLSGKTRVLPNTIAHHTTVSSSVWLPDQGKVLVANGPAPVSQTNYVELPLWERFDPDAFATERHRVYDNTHHLEDHPDLASCEELYIQARQAYEYDNDPVRALDLLDLAAEAHDAEPSVHLSRGLLAIRADQHERAEAALTRAIELGHDPQRELVAHYARGRVRAHRGDRDAALADLTTTRDSERVTKKLQRAATRAATRVQRWGRLKLRPTDIGPMLHDADAFTYEPLF